MKAWASRWSCFQTAAEEHDSKARREDVLNQLLVLLNTAVAENKELRAIDALAKAMPTGEARYESNPILNRRSSKVLQPLRLLHLDKFIHVMIGTSWFP